MAMEKLSMVEQMKNAQKERASIPYETYKDHCKNLLTHSFVFIENSFKRFCKERNEEYKDQVFYCYQDILVYISMCDGEFLQGEYDIYKLLCDWAKIEPLSVNDYQELFNRLTDARVIEGIKLVSASRPTMDHADYRALTSGLCYFAFAGDMEIDEKEYYIIRTFYNPHFDEVPLTWDEFKNKMAQ